MGRKRRVSGNYTAEEPREWRPRAAAFLRKMASRFDQGARNIVEYDMTPRMLASECGGPRFERVFENTPECEWAAWTVFQKVSLHCGNAEARRIFARLAMPLGKIEEEWFGQNLLLSIMESKSYTAGKIARMLASRPKMRKLYGLGSSSEPEVIENHLYRLMRKRKRELRALGFGGVIF
jgi:hypothetical protein